jgi:hypothetical protein
MLHTRVDKYGYELDLELNRLSRSYSVPDPTNKKSKMDFTILKTAMIFYL